jgi:hypothetical protein
VAGGGTDDAGREDEVVGELLGMVMGKPADEHSETTKLATAAWSAASQDFCKHGVTLPTRPGFWQWQAKSVRDEHPSVVSGPTRHDSAQEGIWGS